MAALLREYAPSAIINFAAETHVDRSIDNPGVFVQSNIVGVQNLLDAAVHYQAGLADHESRSFRFLQISTDEVFGSIDGEAVTEDCRYNPNSPYSASKAAADHLVRAYHTTYGLPTLITVATNNYGPLQFPEKLIPLMIVKAVREEPLPIYGDGENVRDWLLCHRPLPGGARGSGGRQTRRDLQCCRRESDVQSGYRQQDLP